MISCLILVYRWSFMNDVTPRPSGDLDRFSNSLAEFKNSAAAGLIFYSHSS